MASQAAGRRRSEAWDHFTAGEDDTAVCNWCGSVLRANSRTHGTSSLLRHGRRCASRARQQQQELHERGRGAAQAQPGTSSSSCRRSQKRYDRMSWCAPSSATNFLGALLLAAEVLLDLAASPPTAAMSLRCSPPLCRFPFPHSYTRSRCESTKASFIFLPSLSSTNFKPRRRRAPRHSGCRSSWFTRRQPAVKQRFHKLHPTESRKEAVAAPWIQIR
jgi:hypothetical protein